MEMLWLAEHISNGICAYVDPVSFAAAIASSTRQIGIGFAVAQMSLHQSDPLRRADGGHRQHQQGPAGGGPGPRHRLQHLRLPGLRIDPAESLRALVEAEDIMIKSWTTEKLRHGRQVLEYPAADAAAAALHQTPPHDHRACCGRGIECSAWRCAGRPFLDEHPVERRDETAQDLYRGHAARKRLR